jgi:hypothetical protein
MTSYGKGDQWTYLQVATDMMAYQQMTFSYGKGDQMTYLQVATDMVRRPKRRMSRLRARGISNSIPTYRRSAQEAPILFCANCLCRD